MCNLYEPADPQQLSERFNISGPLPPYPARVAPLRDGPFITAPGVARVGQWGMIPERSLTRKPTMRVKKPAKDGDGFVLVDVPMSTNNARRERLTTAMTFKKSWLGGRRCLIPAKSFDEPYWGTNSNIWWRFRRADGAPWALAGIWSEWVEPGTGEVVPSFTMITQNCDAHPLLSLMHRFDKKLAADKQDKRAVVPIEESDWGLWLEGTNEDAESLIKLPGLAVFAHGAADPAQQVDIGV